MKSIILLKLFVLCVQAISCDDSLLSKFHQNTYKIKDIRMQLVNYSKVYFNIFDVKTYKYNRTTPAINITLSFKIAVKDKLEVLIQCYKFLSNEYRHFPIRLQLNLKETVDADVIGMGRVRNCGNFGNFVFEKDIKYHACNFVIDESRFPPLIPNGKYKMDIKYLYLTQEIANAFILVEIYIPIAYPKN